MLSSIKEFAIGALMVAAGILVFLGVVLLKVVRLCAALITGLSLIAMIIFFFAWLGWGELAQRATFIHTAEIFLFYLVVTAYCTWVLGLPGRPHPVRPMLTLLRVRL